MSTNLNPSLQGSHTLPSSTDSSTKVNLNSNFSMFNTSIPPKYPLKSIPIPYQYQIHDNTSTLINLNNSSSYIPTNSKKRRNSDKFQILSKATIENDLINNSTNNTSTITSTNTSASTMNNNSHHGNVMVNYPTGLTTNTNSTSNSIMSSTGENNKKIRISKSNSNNNLKYLNMNKSPTTATTNTSINNTTISNNTNISSTVQETTTPTESTTTSNINATTILNNDVVLDDALPLSPVASPGLDQSMDSLLPVSTNSILTANNNTITNNNNTANSIHTTEIMSNYTNDILNNINNQLPEQCIKNLLFKLISSLNRSEISDLSTFLKDNLQRDFITSLPVEVALKILINLSFIDIINCLQTCKNWNRLIINTPYLWKHLLINESFVSPDNFNNYSKKISLEYPQFNSEELCYRYDFLKKLKILKNWYNPFYLPKRTTLLGHMTSVVTCLQFEDNYIITGADDRMIRVYDSKLKKFLLELAGHDGGVWALKYDEDGILVSGSTDRTVRVWDIKRGCCTHIFKGHTSTVRCLDIVKYKNTKYIITGSRDTTLHVWKLPYSVEEYDDIKLKTINEPILYQTTQDNPFFVGILRGHLASVRTVSGHGNIVVSGSYDNNLIVWDIIQMKCLYILTGHTDRIYSTIYDHKRSRCISASMDSTIRVWDLKDIWNNGKCARVMNSIPCMKISGSLYTLQGHTALVGLLRLSDKYLVSAAADGSLRGWDSDDYSRKFAYHHNNLSAITTFYMSDNLLVSGSEGQFNVYNLRSGKLVHANLLCDADQIWSVNFKGNMLVAAVEKDGQSYVELLDFESFASSNDSNEKDNHETENEGTGEQDEEDGDEEVHDTNSYTNSQREGLATNATTDSPAS
ncbi:hypothetical protein TBLA_0D02630 [Henningerozyma blattae CBS 6284]|uniref:F-box domain-containing protein n=1 Tax=Henningerozyma blattae (strain ATCC 34711 / CBS 6284 / DSM 70876 / NBRC 10599 / NRRL Y-10934 / UCD 77-7) TaxID=1071380 RepID=I2H314_HENB6|nr:hypothetical protein TBLA_0D02630 [Tetrapisispora blattae CBS 6284]CCH60766.1 hypothetical protein TBLA_0D02630 [Tetrapisispora blattae CBS 6284]